MRQQSTSYVSSQSSHLPCKIQLLCDQKLPGNGILMQKFLLNLASTIPSWNSATSSNILAKSPPATMSTMVANSCKDLQPTRKEHYSNATYDRQCCRKHRTNVEQNKLKTMGMKSWHSLKQHWMSSLRATASQSQLLHPNLPMPALTFPYAPSTYACRK